MCTPAPIKMGIGSGKFECSMVFLTKECVDKLDSAGVQLLVLLFRF